MYRIGLSLSDEELDRTAHILADHRALPLGQRIVRRLTGKYPSRSDRRQLARREAGPYSRFDEGVQSKTFHPNYFRYPFMQAGQNQYAEMLRHSDKLYLSCRGSLMDDRLALELIEGLDSLRPVERPVDTPYYAGVYRRKLPKAYKGDKSWEEGVFLMDRTGQQVEMVRLDEKALGTLTPELQLNLEDFVSGLPYPEGSIAVQSTLGSIP